MTRDPYEVVLADLRAKRDEIEKLILSLEAFRPPSSVGAHTVAPVATSLGQGLAAGSGPYAGMSIIDAVRSVLKAQGSEMSTTELANAIQAGGIGMKSAEPTNTVSAVLHRARSTGSDIVLAGRGKWALAEWKTEHSAETDDPDASPTVPKAPRLAVPERLQPKPVDDLEDDDIPL